MNLVYKLVLGTVQFGTNYGINNFSGQVPQEEVEKILKLAHMNGIKTLDTSFCYGNSEAILGRVISKYPDYFHVVSKFPPLNDRVKTIFSRSLERLKQDKLYGYLVHNFSFYCSHPKIWDEIKELKLRGYVEKIGFSLYTIEELHYLQNNNVEFDILQFPYNLFDRQFEPYLEDLKNQGVEIYTRSVFLQGLFFRDINSLNKKLFPLKFCLKFLQDYSQKTRIPIEYLALHFVLQNEFIDGVLIGVDNVEQLKNNIEASSGCYSCDFEFVNHLQIQEKYLLNPSNW